MGHEQTIEELETVFRGVQQSLAGDTASRLAGSVYIIELDGIYNIGWARDIEKRMRLFATIIMPDTFKRIFEQECPYPLVIVKTIHKTYQWNRVAGEWFHFDERELAEVKAKVLCLAESHGAKDHADPSAHLNN